MRDRFICALYKFAMEKGVYIMEDPEAVRGCCLRNTLNSEMML